MQEPDNRDVEHTTYSRNRTYTRPEENLEDFWSIYAAIDKVLQVNNLGENPLNDPEVVVEFFDKIDTIWDERLERVMNRKYGWRS